MKILFSIAVFQLFVTFVLATSCTVVVQKVGGKINLDVTDGGNCYNLDKDTATRVVRIDGYEKVGNLVVYNGVDCSEDTVGSGQSPIVFKNPVMIRSIRVNSCT